MEGEAATDSRLEDDSYKENEEAVIATNEAGDSIEGKIISLLLAAVYDTVPSYSQWK